MASHSWGNFFSLLLLSLSWGNTIVPFMTHIINLSFTTGVFPQCLKTAIVKPLLKKPSLDCEVLKNYRPVSNLSFLSKIMERVIAVRLYDHMHKHNLLEEMQSAYKVGHNICIICTNIV